jgi:hypothetical protein
MWGTRAVTIAATAAAFASLLGCGGGSSSPRPTLTPTQIAQLFPLSAESAHFSYHYSDSLPVDPISQEAFYDWIVSQMGVAPTQKIQYYRYANASTIQGATGHPADGYADPPAVTVHSIKPWENHEVVHLLTYLIGPSTDFFGEGFAVAMEVDPASHNFTPTHNGIAVHDLARNYQRAGQLPHATDIVTSDAFQHSGISSSVTYAAAGSFMEYLVEKYGISKSLDLFRSMSREVAFSVIDARFRQIYGISLAQADSDWRAFLSQ